MFDPGNTNGNRCRILPCSVHFQCDRVVAERWNQVMSLTCPSHLVKPLGLIMCMFTYTNPIKEDEICHGESLCTLSGEFRPLHDHVHDTEWTHRDHQPAITLSCW